jgi:hypothetical protein
MMYEMYNSFGKTAILLLTTIIRRKIKMNKTLKDFEREVPPE